MPHTVISASAAEAAPDIGSLGGPVTTGDAATLADIRDELLLQLGGRVEATDTRLNRWINWAYIDLATSIEIPELRSSFSLVTVADQPFYMLPDEVFAVERVVIDDDENHSIHGGLSLERIDLNKYRMLKDYESAAVKAFFRHGRVLVLYPAPAEADVDVVVDFRIRPNKLTQDTHKHILGFEWDEGIILAARHKAFNSLLEFDKAMLAKNDAIDFVRSRMDYEELEDDRIIRSSIPRRPGQLKRNRLI